MQDFVIWLYAGFLAGVVSRMSEEPAYATLFVFPYYWRLERGLRWWLLDSLSPPPPPAS